MSSMQARMECPVVAIDHDSAMVQADWYEEQGDELTAESVRLPSVIVIGTQVPYNSRVYSHHWSKCRSMTNRYHCSKCKRKRRSNSRSSRFFRDVKVSLCGTSVADSIGVLYQINVSTNGTSRYV